MNDSKRNLLPTWLPGGAGRAVRLFRSASLIMAAVSLPVALQAQDGVPASLNVEQLVELLNSGMPQPRVLTIIAGGCVEGGASSAVQDALRQAGASVELLRSAEVFVCEEEVGIAALEWETEIREMEEGESRGVAVTIRGDDGTVLTGRDVSWSVSDETVLSIIPGPGAGAGQLVAVAPGQAEIRAQIEGVGAFLRVTVHPAPGDLRVTPGELQLEPGQTESLTAEVLGTDGQLLSEPVAWVSSNPTVASVAAGTVRALSPGQATVQARVGALSREVSVVVSPARVARLDVEPARLQLDEGRGAPLVASALRVDGVPMSGQTVIWSTSDLTVVEVHPDGYVVARGSGEARVTAEVAGLTAEVPIRVVPVARSLEGVVVAGLLLPGGAQFSAGRAGRGALTILAAGGAAAWGYLSTETTAVCRSPVPRGGVCSRSDILEESVEQPNLEIGVGVAAGIMILSMIDAVAAVNRSNAAIGRLRAEPWVDGAVAAGRDHRIVMGFRLRPHRGGQR